MHFQTISLLRAEEWAHLPSADDHRQTLFTPCRQRRKRIDWRNTQFLHLNQLGLNPQVLTQTSSSCEQISIPQGTILSTSQQSSHQLTRECHHPSRETFRFKPLPPSPQQTSKSLQMVRFKVESRTAMPVW